MLYTVGEMAKLLDIPASTLRFYDKEGLFPFVTRSNSGIRFFQDSDFSRIKMILCLKKAGMQLQEIRQYFAMKDQGDDTLEERLALFQYRRDIIRQQIEDLQQTLEILEYKCWYYEAAVEAGTADALRGLPLDQIPEEHRHARTELRNIKQTTQCEV